MEVMTSSGGPSTDKITIWWLYWEAIETWDNSPNIPFLPWNWLRTKLRAKINLSFKL